MRKYIVIIMSVALFFQSCKDDGNGTETPKPVLNITDAEFFEGDDNNTIQVTVTLTGNNTTNVLVSYATLDVTAVSGPDYIGTSDGELVFGPNDTQKTISITLKGDGVNEPDETFQILILNPSNATISADRATITIKNDDDVNNEIIPSGGYSSPNTYPNMTLAWADEFQGNVLDMANWTHELGNGNNGWGNNELQFYQSDNTFIHENEYLVIEARGEGSSYTSSRIVTKDKQQFQYGRIDIRAALPEGQGLWPALWMLGHDFAEVGWPACGEIDIMELVGHAPNQVHGTVHYGNDVANHYYQGGSKWTSDGSTYGEEFHVFSLVWEEDLIQFLVDDVMYYDVTPADMEGGQPYPFNDAFFFIFNVAVGGDWPGSPNVGTNFPQRMVVDYVRVFQ